MPRLDCTDVHVDLDLLCPENTQGPFLSWPSNMDTHLNHLKVTIVVRPCKNCQKIYHVYPVNWSSESIDLQHYSSLLTVFSNTEAIT